jgi:two-component system OmpR family response regulator
MRGKFEDLANGVGGNRGTPMPVGRQLESIFDVEAPPPLPDHLARLLTQLHQADDKTRGLLAGREDRLSGPSATVELIAGIEVLLRRPTESRDIVLRVGPVELDLIERTVKRKHRIIHLLPREFRLLEYMMRRKNQVLTRDVLLEEVWNYRIAPKTNLVDVHMGKLRRKLDEPHESPMIYNVRGVGFILRAPA